MATSDTNPARPSNRIRALLQALLAEEEFPDHVKAQQQAIIDYLDERWERSQRKSEQQNRKEAYTSIDRLFELLEQAGLEPMLQGKRVTKEEVLAYMRERQKVKEG